MFHGYKRAGSIYIFYARDISPRVCLSDSAHETQTFLVIYEIRKLTPLYNHTAILRPTTVEHTVPVRNISFPA